MSDAIPGWIFDLKGLLPLTAFVGTLLSFARDPLGFILDKLRPWIVSQILAMWGAVLSYVDMLWATLADIPRVAIYEPLVAGFAPLGESIQDIWREFGTIANDVAEAAGPFAPIVVVGFWLIPGLLAIGGVYFLAGFLGTYLPLRSLPGLRRFA